MGYLKSVLLLSQRSGQWNKRAIVINDGKRDVRSGAWRSRSIFQRIMLYTAWLDHRVVVTLDLLIAHGQRHTLERDVIRRRIAHLQRLAAVRFLPDATQAAQARCLA